MGRAAPTSKSTIESTAGTTNGSCTPITASSATTTRGSRSPPSPASTGPGQQRVSGHALDREVRAERAQTHAQRVEDARGPSTQD